ncbi:MAG: PqqD family peptide modification chaperone [Thermoproteota archaeon]
MPLFKKKEPPKVSPERLYRSIPVLNPNVKYEEDSEGLVTILIPMATTPVAMGDSKKAEGAARVRRIKLDIIGSKVWKQIDGKTPFNELVQWMRKEFVLTEREAEVSLSMFMKNLVDKKLVALILPRPKPGTPEVQEEIERIKVEAGELEKAYRKKKIDENVYKEIKERYEEAIKELKELEKSDEKDANEPS